MSRRSAVVSRNQAFSRFLPGAIETIDGETVKVTFHDLKGADFDEHARDFLQHQLRSAILQWPYRDATYRPFVENSDTKGFEFVTSVRLVAQALPVVECRRCGAVVNVSTDKTENKRCRRAGCGGGLRVLPFIDIHGCGHESNVRIPPCPKGHGDQYIKLERHAQRRWACGMPDCDWSEPAFAGYCGKNCYFQILRVTLDNKRKRKSQVLVGSSSVYRTQSIDILNPPQGQLGYLFRKFPEYLPPLFVSDYLGLNHMDFNDLERLRQLLEELKDGETAGAVSGPSVENMIAALNITDEERERLIAAMRQAQGQTQTGKRVAEFRDSLATVEDLIPELATQTVPWRVLKEVYDLCLAINLPNSANLERLVRRLSGRGGAAALSALELSTAISDFPKYGLEDIALITNFPIVSCAYGYSRGPGYLNDDHVLKAFPKRPSVGGGNSDKTPFYVLSTGTEALVVRISPIAMMRYLEANGFISKAELPADDVLRRGWILRQFMDDDRTTNPTAYAMYAAVHSYAHRMLEQIALESCFSTTSLSEMVMPSTLSFAIYVNQRSEFNIGGLSSFVEQRLNRALAAVTQPTPCMFDPICTMKDGGACNGCLYLPEVTCREFNTGLTRSVLHGGSILAQHELGPILGARKFTGFFGAIGRQ
jgi:hypothetical protein